MTVSLQIHPAADLLTMYGHADPSSAYSLSGHVSINITSPFSLFEPRKPARFLLQSVTITFEGQSEVITPNAGYHGLRLCSVTRELAPKTPLEITNEGHEDSNNPCVWNVVFNLPIPGWLPATNTIGVESAGTSYALYATAKYSAMEEETTSSTWNIFSFCNPFMNRVRTAQAQRPITVVRYFTTPNPESPSLNYLVNSTASVEPKPSTATRIPSEVLDKIQVLASVPEYIDIKECTLPLCLRLRTKDMCEDECKKIQITDVSVDVIQRERCRYRPSSEFLARFPLPPKKSQPPNVPLLNPHPLSALYDVAMFVSADHVGCYERSFSLLPSNESGFYSLQQPNYAFANDARSQSDESGRTWYTMDTTIPFIQSTGGLENWGKYDTHEDEYNGLQWAGEKDLRPTSSSPLYSALHELSVSLTFSYDLEGRGGRTAREKLGFKVPITFGRVEPQPADSTTSANQVASIVLPVYSQLYDANGDRKIDYSVPLPLYTPTLDEQTS